MRHRSLTLPGADWELRGKGERWAAGFAVEVPSMRVVGVFERPPALHNRLGFRIRTNEPKLGGRELLAGDEMAHAHFIDRFLLAGFLGFALRLDFTQHLE